MKEKFRKLFFNTRWKPTKDKSVEEVAFEGLWGFIRKNYDKKTT